MNADGSRQANIREFYDGFDESHFPKEFVDEYDIIECLSYDEYCETYLILTRDTDVYAVAKCYQRNILPNIRENELLEKLCHPNLPKYLGTFENRELICIVRERIDGIPLDQVALERVLSQDEVIDIGISLCGTLQYLHNQTPPIIHRDIKPENIILRPNGSVALIDFGISRVFQEDADADTINFGTKCFSAPEQYGYAQTDCRSDQFSMGMVMGYLLTGSTKIDDFNRIADKRLVRFIQTSTAFDPEDRYRTTDDCYRALCALLPTQRKRRKLLTLITGLFAAVCLILIGIFVLRAITAPHFREPLIEQAVRSELGKGENERITTSELALVEELYICNDSVFSDYESFLRATHTWSAESYGERGSLSSLEDVKLLPNLRVISIAAERISDITPLSGLAFLEKIEFKCNLIRDISPLEGINTLNCAGLSENPVYDISPLAACTNLSFLDLCNAHNYEPSALERIGDLAFLDIANQTNSYEYLGIKRIVELKLGYTGLYSLDFLSNVDGLSILNVRHTKLTSLKGIECHQGLLQLDISGCNIDDLSPLTRLPNLQTLILSEDMRTHLLSLDNTSFEVEFVQLDE